MLGQRRAPDAARPVRPRHRPPLAHGGAGRAGDGTWLDQSHLAGIGGTRSGLDPPRVVRRGSIAAGASAGPAAALRTPTAAEQEPVVVGRHPVPRVAGRGAARVASRAALELGRLQLVDAPQELGQLAGVGEVPGGVAGDLAVLRGVQDQAQVAGAHRLDERGVGARRPRWRGRSSGRWRAGRGSRSPYTAPGRQASGPAAARTCGLEVVVVRGLAEHDQAERRAGGGVRLRHQQRVVLPLPAGDVQGVRVRWRPVPATGSRTAPRASCSAPYGTITESVSCRTR